MGNSPTIARLVRIAVITEYLTNLDFFIMDAIEQTRRQCGGEAIDILTTYHLTKSLAPW